MIALETLLTNLGITQHMAAFSDWRDDLIRAHAAELQAVHIAKDAEREAAVTAAIESIQPPPPAELTIKSWQAKAILEAQGLLDAAETVIAGMPDGIQKIAVQSAWRNNADFPRQSETILTLAAAIGLTESQVDEMFSAAAQLTI